MTAGAESNLSSRAPVAASRPVPGLIAAAFGSPIAHALLVLCSFSCLFVLYFSPVLARNKLLAPGDGLVFWLPAFLRPRTWWTPFIYSGYPIAAEPTLQTFYPLSWLCAQVDQWNVFMVAAYVIAAAGAYAYVFTLTRSIRSGFVAGVIFGSGGFLLAHLGHASVVHGAAWIPVILWALENLRHGRRAGWIAIAAIAVANCILGGHPQMWAYGLGLAVAYGALVGRSAPSGRRWFYTWSLFALVAGIGLAAVQLLPAIELISQTVRARIPFDVFVSAAMPPREALQQLFPYLYGSIVGSIYRVPYFGTGGITETAAYVGWLPLGLAAIALLAPADRVVTRFWMFVAVLTLLYACGDATPVATLVYQFPVYGGFRCPARGLMLMTLAVATLAGMGIAAIEQGDMTQRRRAYQGAAILLTIAGAGITCIFLLRGSLRSAAVAAGIGELPVTPWTNPAVGIPLALAVAGAGAIAFYGRRPSRPRATILLLLTVLDLASFGWFTEWHTFSPEHSELQRPAALERYAGELSSAHERLFPYELFGPVETAPPNRNVLWQIASATGLSSVPLSRYFDLLLGVADRSTDDRALDMLAVRYISIHREERANFEWLPEDLTLLSPRGINQKEWTVPAVQADEVGLVAALANSVNLGDGSVVAQLEVTTLDGQVLSFPLRAGTDLSDWAYDQPDVRPRVRHRQAAVFEDFWSGSSRGYRYLARVSLPQPHTIRGIRIVSTAPEGEMVITRLSLRQRETGVSYPIGSFLADREHWRPVENFGSFTVYENQRAMPRAWLVGRVQTLPPHYIIRAIRRGRLPHSQPFDLRTTALVEDRFDFATAPTTAADTVSVERIEDTAMQLRTRSANAAFLVVSDVYYAGWQAFVDGRPTPLYRTNYILRGLVVPAGEHTVELVFGPRSIFFGIAIALASVPTLLLGVWMSRRRVRLEARYLSAHPDCPCSDRRPR